MTASTLAGGLTALPRPYLAHLTDATVPAQPVIPEDMRRLATDALAALRQASGELPVPELGVPATRPPGWHRAEGRTRPTITDDPGWSPLPAWERQAIAPTYWADRLLPGGDGLTGRIPAIPAEVTR